MSDNWKHRNEGMKCKTCMWFVPKVRQAGPQPSMETNCGPGEILRRKPVSSEHIIVNLIQQRPYDLGRCRRHAPTMSGWPVMFVNDWCGDHKIDEEKI